LDDKYFFNAMSFISAYMGRDVDIIQQEQHRLSDVIRKEGILWKKKH